MLFLFPLDFSVLTTSTSLSYDGCTWSSPLQRWSKLSLAISFSHRHFPFPVLRQMPGVHQGKASTLKCVDRDKTPIQKFLLHTHRPSGLVNHSVFCSFFLWIWLYCLNKANKYSNQSGYNPVYSKPWVSGRNVFEDDSFCFLYRDIEKTVGAIKKICGIPRHPIHTFQGEKQYSTWTFVNDIDITLS